MGIFPGNIFRMHFIPKSYAQISLAFHPQLTPLFLRLPGTVPNQLQSVAMGWRWGTAGLLQGAAVRFRCWSRKFPGRIACLFP